MFYDTFYMKIDSLKNIFFPFVKSSLNYSCNVVQTLREENVIKMFGILIYLICIKCLLIINNISILILSVESLNIPN